MAGQQWCSRCLKFKWGNSLKSALIIDDVAADRFFARRGLRKLYPDVAIHEFSYADEALAFLKSPNRDKLDLVLVDINMPRMDGFEFAEAYQQLYPELKGSAEVYVMSSSINPDDQSRALAFPEIAGFLTKPVTKEALSTLI